ncbi:hypothetical protein O9Z70_02400 [Devosia sp. YIM 151766]|nr:hypothetical protein [Devosia sp. YIM 151766]WIY53408.1 hypothetical protein O9Z70_02400 [Devosia sp. YIM 151766]
MTELEIAFVGLMILIGAGAIVYAGLRGPKPESRPDGDGRDAGAD